MRDDTTGFEVFMAGAVFVALIAWGVIYQVNEGWKHEAVKHQAAEFYLDEKHERQWRWLK